jgi:hypothetical protein
VFAIDSIPLDMSMPTSTSISSFCYFSFFTWLSLGLSLNKF